MPRCCISLGGNLGDVGGAFDQALARLAKTPGTAVIAVSGYHRTKPIGEQAGQNFLNAAADIETRLSPLDFLELLQTIERDLGRARTIRWGPRTLDLDLLYYGSEIIDSPQLVVPHPAAWYRRFVLDPLVEIAPNFVHPVRRADIQTLRARLLPRPLVAKLAGGAVASKEKVVRTFGPTLPNVVFVDWKDRDAAERPGEAALTFWFGAPDHPVGLPALRFEDLPVLSRLDVTQTSEPEDAFVRAVLQSALG